MVRNLGYFRMVIIAKTNLNGEIKSGRILRTLLLIAFSRIDHVYCLIIDKE